MSIQHRLTRRQERTDDARRRRVYLVNLPTARSRIEVGDFIQQQGFGDDLVVCYWDKLAKDGPHNGRCWVNFVDEPTAQRAIDTINGRVFDGKRIRAEQVADLTVRSQKQPNTPPTHSPGQPTTPPSAPGPPPVQQSTPTRPAIAAATDRAANRARFVKGVVGDLDNQLDQERRLAEGATQQPTVVEASGGPSSAGEPILATLDKQYEFFMTPFNPAPPAQAKDILETIRDKPYPKEYFPARPDLWPQAVFAFTEHCKELDGAYMRAGVRAGFPVLKKMEYKGGAEKKLVTTNAVIARQYPAPSKDNNAFADLLPVTVYKTVMEEDKFWQPTSKDVVEVSAKAAKGFDVPKVARIGEMKAVALKDVDSYVSDGWDVWHQVITPPGEDTETIARMNDVWSMDEPWKDTMAMFPFGIELSGVKWAPGMTLPLQPQEPDPFMATSFMPPSETGQTTRTATSGCHIPVFKRPQGIGAGWGDYDLFDQWQSHGRQIKPEFVENRDWTKDPLAPTVFVEEGTGKEKVVDMVLPSIALEQQEIEYSKDSKTRTPMTLYEKTHPWVPRTSRGNRGPGTW